MLSKKRNGWLWVVMLFAVCAVVYGMLSSYPRELAVYSDELRYLDVARSLLQGRGLRVRNMPSDYQKILYPLCILPALLLKTTAAQITAIGWLNAVYMASAVFPAYALARAMGMNRRRTAFLVGVTAVLPTMSAASTFMSETVFLPLSLWQVYFFLRAMLAEPKARVGWCAAAGAFCYLLYLNKEVALYYLIAWVLVRAWVWWHDKASWRAELACNAALLGSFLVCFLLAKATLFRGLGNSYNQTGWLTAEQCMELGLADRYAEKDADMTQAAALLQKANLTLEQRITVQKSLAAQLRQLAADAGPKPPCPPDPKGPEPQPEPQQKNRIMSLFG